MVTYPVLAKNILTETNRKTKLELTTNSPEKLVFINTIGKITAEKITQEQTDYTRLTIPSYTPNSTIGIPELPVKRQLIEIPYYAHAEITILGYDVTEYQLSDLGMTQPLYPVQPSQPKCGSRLAFEINNNAYQQNKFTSDNLVTLDILGRMRGVEMGRLSISPVQYNPMTNTIKVYDNLRFEINFVNADLGATQSEKARLASPYFTAPYSSLINYTPAASRENMTQYPVKYVIVSDPMFADQLQPFVEWKTRKGFTVVEAYTDVIGSSLNEIKTYLQGLYDAGTSEDPAPSFVLFVGDISEIPAWNNGDGVTDRNYVEYTGDLFPEVFYGRFSAQNTAQLQPYIDKTLQYEQYTMPNTSFLDSVVMIAGMDGTFGPTHGNGQINYGTINYFNEDHGIYSHTYLYPESGNNAENIRQNVSDGVGFVNYTAHGSPSGWADPSFSISDIPNLTNQDKYGLLIGNCCSTSEYQTNCFAEEIVRAANKGALGYIGGSNSTYWDEDYYFGVGLGAISGTPPSYEETGLGNYDRAFHDHGEPFNEWYTTMDQHIFAGNLAVTESGSSFEGYYWDIYNLMGDPSLMIYYSVPDAMTVSHPSAITLGQTSITITAVPYAYVGLSFNNELHGMGIADASGVLVLDFEAFAGPGDAQLVVTAQNYQPYISNITVIPAEGPYVVYESHLVTGLGFTYHTSEVILLTMQNVGAEDAVGVQVLLTTDNPYVTLIDTVLDFGDIAAGQSVEGSLPFRFDVADDIPDQEVILFNVMATLANNDTFESSFVDVGHAPVLNYAGFFIDDSQGNNNGRLDPGETADLSISVNNTGSATARYVNGLLTTDCPYLNINQAEVSYGQLLADSVVTETHQVTAAQDAPSGVMAIETIDWLGDFGITGTGTFSFTIGSIPVLIVDLAQSNNSPADMITCFNVLTVGYELTTTLPESLDLYQSIFVCLGTYPNNYVLTDSEGNKLADFLNNGGRIFMEGGDTWAFDSQTAAHVLFHITGDGDGSGDLAQVTGVTGTFAENYDFVYDGANSYIDHLIPDANAFTLFRNVEMGYDVAIAYENDVYKTIGTSFEFTGLIDNASSSKDGLMAEILNFFKIAFVWTGIETSQKESFELMVYPNPVINLLNIRVNTPVAGKCSVSLLDVLGRNVLTNNQNTRLAAGINEMNINVDKLRDGMYYLKVKTPAGEQTKKIIIN
ncbi:MAG: C25 family cysteine peptidase [Bacteroidales bacterium]|nr:C25 family cysteine peptidase [Bacteroidales bacterium]